MSVRINLGDDPRDVSDDAAVLYDILHDVNYNLGRLASVAEAWAAPRSRVVRPDLDRYFVIDREGLTRSIADALHERLILCEAFKDFPDGHTAESHIEDAEHLVESMR